VVFTFQFEPTLVKHIGHALNYWFHFLDRVRIVESLIGWAAIKHFLEVDPSAQVVRHCQLLVLSFSFHLISVKVPARGENEFTSNHLLLQQELMQLFESVLHEHALVDLVLIDSRQLCAEFRQLWLNDWLNIRVEY